MQEIQAPHPIPQEGRKLFLAGSIEMGKAREWQKEVIAALQETDWIILNPRRDSWDSSWRQEIENEKFKEQVEWELQGQEEADVVLMHFVKDSKSPISLLELGLFARSGKMIVVCDQDFWREGNVDVVCEHYGVRQLNTIEEAIELLKED